MLRVLGFFLICGAVLCFLWGAAEFYIRRGKAMARRAVARMEEELEIDKITPYLGRARRQEYERIVRNYKETHPE